MVKGEMKMTPTREGRRLGARMQYAVYFMCSHRPGWAAIAKRVRRRRAAFSTGPGESACAREAFTKRSGSTTVSPGPSEMGPIASSVPLSNHALAWAVAVSAAMVRVGGGTEGWSLRPWGEVGSRCGGLIDAGAACESEESGNPGASALVGGVNGICRVGGCLQWFSDRVSSRQGTHGTRT